MKILVCYQTELAKQFKIKLKKQRGGFLIILLGTLGASLLGNILTGKGINTAKEGVIRAGYRNKKGGKATTKRQDHENKMDF